jgi:hypothetical protein
MKYKKIDPEFVRKALGAEEMSALNLEEITEKEIEGKASLGKTYGVSFNHCVYLCRKYGKESSKMKYYRYFADENDEFYQEMKQKNPGIVCVEFYGD